jgi:predicted ATPase/class 3 adenylate cyclase/Tfp pilus assembly protein PilF
LTLPTGTVTFLFTDIEGSTRQWERFPEAMKTALARHDEILRRAVTEYGGWIIKMRGDGVQAVFTAAQDALAAVLEGQSALVREPWPEPVTIRARMALHSGEAQIRADDYYGAAVNRAARIVEIGHGGQVLLSGVTCGLIAHALPPGVALQDLGLHRFKDLQQPEQIFQLLHPALPADFPPLKSLDPIRTNLPIQLTSFIGREREKEEVSHLLTSTRLLTLTGAGGTGKTRLSMEIGAERLDEFADGVWLVELASVSDPELVPQSVAQALSLREEPGRRLAETLTDYLRGRCLLLILDNCEHLLNACAMLAEQLLRACNNLKILATSREGLRLGAEQTYRVPSLRAPDPQSLPRPDEDLANTLLEYDAIRLFIERARRQRADFTLTRQSAPAVAAICHRLDGIPLALELAAARLRSLSVEQISARLDQRFRLLTGGSRTVLPRQQTLRALIDWSYDLLTPQERTLLHRLSVFAGGWTLEAAEDVCGEGVGRWALGVRTAPPLQQVQDTEAPAGEASPQRLTPNAQRPLDVLDLLTSLVDKSLVIFDEREDIGRYRMLESVQQYGEERLQESGETTGTRDRHLFYFRSLAEAAEPHLAGQDQLEWLNRLETEHDNMRAALNWGLKQEDEAVPHVCVALLRFWSARGYLTEGRRWCEAALAMDAALAADIRAAMCNGAGILAWWQGDHAAARDSFTQSMALFEEMGKRSGIAGALGNLGLVASRQGDYTAAVSYHERSLALYRELGDRRNVAYALNNLGMATGGHGNYAAARAYYEESLTIKRELGDQKAIGGSLHNLGLIAESQGDHATARAYYEQSLAVRREIGDRQGMAGSLNSLGAAESDYAAKRAYYEESLAIRRQIGDRWGTGESLHNLGAIDRDRGNYAAAWAEFEESLTIKNEIGDRPGLSLTLDGIAVLRVAEVLQATPNDPAGTIIPVSVALLGAARLWAAAEALREQMGAPLSQSEQEWLRGEIERARSLSDEAAFAAAWAEGEAMTLAEAINAAQKPV